MLRYIWNYITRQWPKTRIVINSNDDQGITSLDVTFDSASYHIPTTTEYANEDLDLIFAIIENARTHDDIHSRLLKLCDTGVPF